MQSKITFSNFKGSDSTAIVDLDNARRQEISACAVVHVYVPRRKMTFIWNDILNIAYTFYGPSEWYNPCETNHNDRPRHTKDVKNGRFALLSLALGINELGIRLGGSESV